MSLLVDDIVINPEETGEGLTEASLSELGLTIVGADFGESAIEGTAIRTERGQILVDRKAKPRTIGLTLAVREEAGVTLAEAVHGFEVIVGELQSRGRWLRRDFHIGDFAGGLLYRVSGEVSVANFGGWQAGASPDVSLTLGCDMAGLSTEEVEHLLGGNTNPLTNPSFETNTAGWSFSSTGWASGSLTRVEGSFAGSHGSYVGRVLATKDATGTLRTGSIASTTAVGSIEPGQVWSLAINLKSTDAPAGGWRGRVDWYTAATTYISSSKEVKIPAGAATPDQFVLEGLEAPAGASRATLVLAFESNVSGDTVSFDVDAFMMREGASAGEYFEGSTRELIYELPASMATAEGLRRIRAKNQDTSAHWRGLLWAEECDTAPADLEDPTALLAYAAADLTPKGGAVVKTVSGVELVEHSALSPGWLTILESNIDDVGHMTHQGPRRPWLRAYDPGEVAGEIELRVHWRALGALGWSEDNAIVPTPIVDGWQWLDMGECRPQPAVVGDERWEFRVQARALNPSTGRTIRIDRVCPLPTEQYVVVRAPGQEQGADAQSIKSPGTVTSSAGEGGGSVDWSNPTNAASSNNSRATATRAKELADAPSYWLKATDFAFAIPETATVLGVVPEFERSADHVSSTEGFVADNSIRLVVGGVISGSDRSNGAAWSTSEDYVSFGGSDDLWGLSLSPAVVNASGFGVALKALLYSSGTSITASVDHVQITVYYTEATDTNKVCFAQRSIELRSDGIYRQHLEDDVWGRLVPDGFYPVAKPGGLEGRPSRGILIPTQGDFGGLADAGTIEVGAIDFTRNGHHFARGVT